MFLDLLILHPYGVLSFLLYKLIKASVNHHIDTKDKRPVQYSLLGSYSLCVREMMTGFIVYFILYCFMFIHTACMW